MNRIKRLLIVLLLAIPLAVAGVYLFKTLDARDGLTSSQVNCVLKDSRGYLWFGTTAGLYRYDGYTFRNFQCNSQDGSSLPDSYIISMQETLEGTLWIETSAGFCVYHPQTENFERDMKQVYTRMGIEGQPNVVYVDRHKNFWASIPNKGVVAYNQQQQTNYEFGYTNDAVGIPQGNIVSISECRDGAILVYEDGRLVCCDIMHQQHTVWGNSTATNSRNINHIVGNINLEIINIQTIPIRIRLTYNCNSYILSCKFGKVNWSVCLVCFVVYSQRIQYYHIASI